MQLTEDIVVFTDNYRLCLAQSAQQGDITLNNMRYDFYTQ